MAQVYTVTANTSVVLVSTITVPNTIVLLNSISTAGHLVGIRDTTGSSQIAQYPIIVSTVSGVSFFDGRSSMMIQNPYGSLTVSSKDTRTWQLLNSIAYQTSLPTAFVETLGVSTLYSLATNSLDESVSSLMVGNLTVLSSIQVLGTTTIGGPITIQGSFTDFSSLRIFESMYLSSGLLVGGNAVFPSSLAIQDTLFVEGYLSTLQSLQVHGDLLVDSNLSVYGALLPNSLSAQKVTVDTLYIEGGLLLAGGISSSVTTVTEDMVVGGKGVLQGQTTVHEMLAIVDELNVRGSIQTSSLAINGSLALDKEVIATNLIVSGSVSTLSTLYVHGRLTASDDCTIGSDIIVTGITTLRDLIVAGNTTISSLAVYSTLQFQGSASQYASTFGVRSELVVVDNFGIGTSVFNPKAFVSAEAGLSTQTDLDVYGSLIVGGTVTAENEAWIRGTQFSVSTLSLAGTLSTTSLEALGTVVVDGNLSVNGIASASTLGAPISFDISTLTLSNAMIVGSYGSIPFLDMNEYPAKIAAGPNPLLGSNDIAVDGILLNRSTIQQLPSSDFLKRWVTRELTTSTLSGQSNLSSVVFGNPETIEYPRLRTNGFLVTGSTSADTNIYWSLNPSTTFYKTLGKFPTTGYKLVYNDSNRWVAVGRGVTSNDSILTSEDGYSWINAATGGFTNGAYGVAYGAGRWVAVGDGGIWPVTRIQYSGNGVNWSNTSGVMLTLGYGVAYDGAGTWVAVGEKTGGFGILSSSDGITWAQASTPGPPPPLNFYSIAYGNGLWMASGSNVSNQFTSTDGSIWIQANPGSSRRCFAYNGAVWVGGGDAISGNPLTTLQWSLTGSNWNSAVSGGFKTSCFDILWNSNQNLFVAVGSNLTSVEPILQYSSDGKNWVSQSVFPGIGRGVGYGSLLVPLYKPYLTLNMQTIVRSTLSSTTLFASTVVASTVTGTYSSDGSYLSMVGSYTSSIYTSSLTATILKAYDISAGIVQANQTFLQDSLTIQKVNFFSSANLYLVGGSDSLTNANIQVSSDGINWTPGLQNFTYYANGVSGTGNIQSPFFVAVGGDATTLGSIQWSTDGRNWNAATSGGFSYATPSGIHEGRSVVYNTSLARWVAVGVDTGATTTILTSVDGSNWSAATNGFLDYGTSVKTSPFGFVALGTSVRWSLDGVNWTLVSGQSVFDAVAYGTLSFGSSVSAWLGILGYSLYYSLTNGSSWQVGGGATGLRTTDLYFANSLWVAVGPDGIQYSINGFSWTASPTSFPFNTEFRSVTYNTNQQRWVATAKATVSAYTLWYSIDGINWGQSTSGGFSTAVLQYGAGYGITSLGASTFAVGVSALDIATPTKTSILKVFSTLTNEAATSISLTTSNTANVFSTIARGIAATNSEIYKYVVVGDGQTPQKTIGRSLDASPGSWIPAITGGFSTTGYGVTYALDKWIAVGDAQTTINTIQYSSDGANWFGTNNATALRLGGRGVGVGVSSFYSTIIAVGKDTGTNTLVYSRNGYGWSNTSGIKFNVQGNGVGFGTNFPSLPYPFVPSAQYIAVGEDTRGCNYTVLKSPDGITWTTIASPGGFSKAGYGAAYDPNSYRWVIVGDDADSNNTIQVSYTGGDTFTGTTNAFTGAGYGVTYNSSLKLFYAVGKDKDGIAPYTVKYSGDGIVWSNVTNDSGFISQKTLGAGTSVYTQGIFTSETVPYIEMEKLIVYERATPLLYTKPSIRLQSTFMTFSESLFINLSSQVILGSNVPFLSSAVTVYGGTYTSSFFYDGYLPLTDPFTVSTLVVSTLSSVANIQAYSLTTPSLGINIQGKANLISSLSFSGYSAVNINNALFVPTFAKPSSFVGIGTANPRFELEVQGTLAVSSVSTSYLYAPDRVKVTSSNVYFTDQYLSMFEGTNPMLVTTGNFIQTEPSSITFNSILTLNVSTQQMGVFTRNPHYDLDVQRHGYVTSVTTNVFNTSLLYLTLQSV